MERGRQGAEGRCQHHCMQRISRVFRCQQQAGDGGNRHAAACGEGRRQSGRGIGAVGADGEVVAVETDPGAVADALVNLGGYNQVVVVEDKVSDAIAQAPEGFTAEVVVLDPPRAGAGRAVVAGIAGLEPRVVAYVACDPAALARDLGYFAEHGYRLDTLRAFDLFPMTHHVEAVGLLVRQDAAR